MNKYYKFDAESFIRDSLKWDEDLKKLQKDLESITLIGGSGGSIPNTNEVSRPVEKSVVSRDTVLEEINHIWFYKDVYEKAWKMISDYDREMITGFFFSKVNDFIADWMEKYTSNRQYCYRDRREALAHFSDAVEEILG